MTKMASPVGWRNFSIWRCEIKATSAKLGGIGCISQQALPQLTTLDGVGLDRIHRSFIEAFSDYQVDIDLPLEGLRSMIVRNDIALGRSVGCWVGEELAGFILCGYRSKADTNPGLLYDGGTGVLPHFRRQGIAKRMLCALLQTADADGCAFVLEVLQENTKALDLYSQHGFSIVRNFDCFCLESAKIGAVGPEQCELVTDWETFCKLEVQRYMTYRPSWQNERTSILACAGQYRFIGLQQEGRLAAFAVVGVGGDIPQFGMLPDRRDTRTFATLLGQARKTTSAERLKMINVEHDSVEGQLAQSSGFSVFARQFEMVRAPRKPVLG